MKVSPYEIEWPEPYAIATDGKDQSRSEGLHLSTVLKKTAVRMGWINEKNGNDFLCHLGIAFENYAAQMIARLVPDMDFHPGEFIEDGIAMSPDGIQYTENGPILHEYKLTWQKASKPIDAMWYYLCQLKSYCRAAGTNIGVLHIGFAAGFYQPPFPVYSPLKLEFTNQELKENWNMVLREAQSLR